MKTNLLITIALVLLVSLTACQRRQFPLARAQPSNDAPKYTVEGNLTGDAPKKVAQ